MYKIRVLLVFVLTLAVLTGCVKSQKEQADLPARPVSFRDVPGITQDEISAIEALQKKYGSFVFGMSPSTEAFTGKDGEINGYTALFCEWLTSMFGIPIKIELYEWADLLNKLESGNVDFTGELMNTSELRKSYFMTSPILERSVKIYRIKGGEPIENLLKRRKPRYAFFKNSILSVDVAENVGYKFEAVFVDGYKTAYRMLKSGEVDAYFGLNTSEAAFDAYGDVVSENFYPLILKSFCMSAHKAELQPLINVINKAFNERTLDHLSELYEKGYQQYLENKFYNMLTNEEREYIQNNPVIPIAAEFNNYPICFFDVNTDHWHGIFYDALEQITKLTGLKFENASDYNTPYQDLITMLENGKALIKPELFRLKEYEGRFIWSENPLLEDTFAFYSKANFKNIELNQVPYLKTAIRRNSIYYEIFQKIFPNHPNLFEYDTIEEVWGALKRDEVEIIFACNRRLLTYTNFYGEAGYKLNLKFDYSSDPFLGYNKDAVILKSIIDKSMGFINLSNIVNQWMHKTYDYRYKLSEAQRPWLIGASVLFFTILILVSFLLIKSLGTGKHLETLVMKRTNELSYKTSQLQMMIDSIPDLLFCKDTDLKYTQCNKHFEEFIGVKEGDVLGKTDIEGKWLSADSTGNIANIEQSVISEAKMNKFEEFVSSSITGKGSFFETVKAPLIQNGVVVGMMGIARDITRRKEMEKEIAYQTTLFKTMIDSIPDAVFCKDVNLNYTMCNKYMSEILGVKKEYLVGKNNETGLNMTVESLELSDGADKKVISERERVEFEEWLMCSDGVFRLFETVKVPLLLEDEIIGVLGIARDITKRKEMEEQIKEASRAKSDFLANMSHEIRTPLNVIIGLTDLVLEDENLEENVSDNLVKISSAGNTLLSIVNDILDFSKIESGNLRISPVKYYMSSLLNDVITIVITRLGEKPITFSLNIGDDLPAKLYGDDLRVKQILTNLLSNSVKYTHRGKIELTLKCIREGNTVWMDIIVSDTGIGIRENDLKNLFVDYFQAGGKATRNIEGTGLGLPITKRLVEMMDGEIHAESEYGKGTTFRVRIRQGFAEDATIGFELADKLRTFHYDESKRIAAKRLVRLNLSYAKVLVVDDMQTNLDVAVGLLRKYNMQVDCVVSGPEAIEKIREGNPVYNAIFMDHMMPDMDGIEAAEKIRELDTKYAKNIPIIALTANAIHGTANMFYERGFQAFISKPIDIMEMDSVIRKWVRNEAQEKALGIDPSSISDIPTEEESNLNIEINIPGVDTERGLALYGGDTKIYLALLRSYVSNIPATLNKLRAVSKETLPEYVIAVHGLKGTSAGIGAETIRSAALNLENISRAGDLDGVLAGNGKLISDTEVVVASIKKWLEQYDAVNVKQRIKSPDLKILARLRQSCEKYDMAGIDKAMSELESVDYEEGGDLITWLKDKIEVSEITEAAARIAQYEKELK